MWGKTISSAGSNVKNAIKGVIQGVKSGYAEPTQAERNKADADRKAAAQKTYNNNNRPAATAPAATAPAATAQKINEGLSEKGIVTVQKWVAEHGARTAAVKMIDSVLAKIIGLSSSDMGDTYIFANGLDEIESVLENGDFQIAYDIAKDTAKEMIEDEGGGDMFGESKK
jgi:hypothetical protein